MQEERRPAWRPREMHSPSGDYRASDVPFAYVWFYFITMCSNMQTVGVPKRLEVKIVSECCVCATFLSHLRRDLNHALEP